MKAVLLLETSSKRCSVAVAVDGALVAERDALDPQGYLHAERLHPMIDEVLRDAGFAVRELTGIAAAQGPGSYTGLRIGLAAAKGLALPWDIPCYGLDSLAMLAVAAAETDPTATRIWAAMDARRLEVYSAWFSPDGQRLSPDVPEVAQDEWADRPEALGAGDGIEKIRPFWPSLRDSGVRYAFARHGIPLLASAPAVDLATWEPNYLKVFGQAL